LWTLLHCWFILLWVTIYFIYSLRVVDSTLWSHCCCYCCCVMIDSCWCYCDALILLYYCDYCIVWLILLLLMYCCIYWYCWLLMLCITLTIIVIDVLLWWRVVIDGPCSCYLELFYYIVVTDCYHYCYWLVLDVIYYCYSYLLLLFCIVLYWLLCWPYCWLPCCSRWTLQLFWLVLFWLLLLLLYCLIIVIDIDGIVNVIPLLIYYCYIYLTVVVICYYS